MHRLQKRHCIKADARLKENFMTPSSHLAQSSKPFSASQVRLLRAAFTPDPDDAFAWWAIATRKLKIEGCNLHTETHHIQTINEGCLRGQWDIGAVSSAVWPRIAEHYRILSAGASVGRGYGPALAALPDFRESDLLRGKPVAVPGDLTTGGLLLKIFYPGVRTVSLPFDQVARAILRQEVSAGVLIHEELLNWRAAGLVRIECLGERWTRETGLPIPVGLNVVHRRLGDRLMAQVGDLVRESMVLADRYAEEAGAWAMSYSRQAETGIGPKFIRMFANQDTLRLGEDCLAALRELFRRAQDHGFIEDVPNIDVI
jgi:1,4-dihydroxy-6-naphthoate synthase